MDYEKLYKEALERAKKLKETCDSKAVVGWCEYIFPELKESEDEKIRKGIIKYLSWIKDRDGSYMPNNIPFDDMIIWLEKQGEQKPNWSEEDEIALCDTLWCCKQAASIAKNENDMGNIWYAEKWLKSLKERMKGE